MILDKENLKVGNWVIWSSYVCQITDVREQLLVLQPIGLTNPFCISYYLPEELTVISEHEAVWLILKNYGSFIDNSSSPHA